MRRSPAASLPFDTVAFRRAMLAWYDKNRRDLPWRRTRDPYAIWLSEIMLQQTTVRTVEPRWRRFLEKFPTVGDLAAAPLDDVLAEWTGLGYYARARNLHAAARRVADDFGGQVPEKFELLLALPGMGRYTAAAVASIAFGEAVAVVDANVERVVARIDAMPGDVTTPGTKRALWERAQEVLAPRRAGDWNQAMMELGAVVCLPRAPQCPLCPVASHCRARATGTPEKFPVKAAKAPMTAVREVAVVLRRGTAVLVLQRPPRGSFASMWELPRGEAGDDEPVRDAAARIVREQTGIDAEPARAILQLKHVVMRRQIDLQVWEANADPPDADVRETPRHTAHEWIAPSAWLTRPVSTTQKDIAAMLSTGQSPKGKSRREEPVDTAPDMFDGMDG